MKAGENFGESHIQKASCVSWGTYCWKTSLRFVERKANINTEYYIENMLKPLCEKDIPQMFRGRKFKPVLHQDNASAHAARKT